MSWLERAKVRTLRIFAVSNDSTTLVGNEEESSENELEESEVIVVAERIESHVTASQILTSLAASLGTLMIGYCTAYTSPALVSMAENGTTVEVSPDQASWIGSLMPLFALPGGFLGGTLIEHIGRKMAIEVTALPLATAGLLIAFAPRIELIYFGRILQGLAVGVLSVAVPVYLAETSHNSIRGTLSLIPGTFGGLGILICYTAGTFIGWRVLSAISSGLALMFFIFSHFLPSSPHWLLTKGRREEAHRTLTFLRHKRVDIHQEFSSIEMSVQSDEPYRCDFLSLVEPQHVKALIIAVSLMVIQQLCGINAVVFYSANIFRDAGSSLHENISSIIIAVINIAATLLSTLLIDRAGRKRLLLGSTISMGVSLIALGGFFYIKHFDPQAVVNLGWIPLCLLVIVVASFSLGLGPVPWLIMSEIFSSDVRSAASALATACNWTCVFVVTKVFPVLVDKVGNYSIFWAFSGVCFIGTFFTVLMVPETMGKTLEEIQEILNPQPVTDSSDSDNSVAIRSDYPATDNS